MMISREHNRVRFKQEIDTAVDKLKSVSGHAGGRKVRTAYTLINYDSNEHRFEEQNLKGHGENVIEPTSNVRFIHFLRRIISIISGLLSYPLSFSRKENRPIGFGYSKKYHN
jgi:hypothetical protein